MDVRSAGARGRSTVTRREALGVYGLLSNFTHPTLHVTREMREWVQDGDDMVSVHQLDLQFVERQARLGVAVFYNELYLTSYFGWPRELPCVNLRLVDLDWSGVGELGAGWGRRG